MLFEWKPKFFPFIYADFDECFIGIRIEYYENAMILDNNNIRELHNNCIGSYSLSAMHKQQQQQQVAAVAATVVIATP